MRIYELDILIERVATQYFYHGTTIDRLDSILKHGLLPGGNLPYSGIKNRDTLRRLGKETNAGNYDNSEWESLNGVYVSNSLKIAINAAEKAGNDEPIIVIIATSLPSTLPDEDLINILMKESYYEECSKWGTFEDEYGLKAYLEDYWDEDSHEEWNRFREKVITRFHNLASKGHPHIVRDDKLLGEAFDYWYEMEFEGGIGDLGNQSWYDVKDTITKKYRNMDSEYFNAISRRITKPVTFSGRNRITAVIGIDPPRIFYGAVPNELKSVLKKNYRKTLDSPISL